MVYSDRHFQSLLLISVSLICFFSFLKKINYILLDWVRIISTSLFGASGSEDSLYTSSAVIPSSGKTIFSGIKGELSQTDKYSDSIAKLSSSVGKNLPKFSTLDVRSCVHILGHSFLACLSTVVS